MKGFVKLSSEELKKIQGGIGRRRRDPVPLYGIVPQPRPLYGVVPLYGITPQPLYGFQPADTEE